jgi:hypothetical protein
MTGDLSACKSKRTLIQLLTVNNGATRRGGSLERVHGTSRYGLTGWWRREAVRQRRGWSGGVVGATRPVRAWR